MPGSFDQITNFVVLMMENRSFDHMVGFMKAPDYQIEGLDGTETIPADPANPASVQVQVNSNAGYRGDFNVQPNDSATFIDPNHDVPSVHDQLFLGSSDPNTPKNKGFVANYLQQKDGHQNPNTPDHAKNILNCFAPENLPVITTLAKEFALCDQWHASVPGPTWPNRLYVHAATSAGQVDNNLHEEAYNIDTIYDRLTEKGEPWKIYFHDFPQSLALTHLQLDSVVENRYRLFTDFLEDAKNGHLPAYSFIEPRYTDFLFIKANDQHPPHDVGLGEHLIADVYEAVRNGPQWKQTVLVVLWDEHGGIFDHVPPPATVNPDGKVSANPPCDFKRLGVRVPALIISPYIPKGTISHTVYDHTSVLATVEKRFGLRSLTERDKAAATFESVLGSTLRTDAPESLARPTDSTALKDYHASKSRLASLTNDAVRDALRAFDFAKTPATEFQISLVKLAKSIFVRGETKIEAALRLSQWAEIEHDAAAHVREFTSKFFRHLF